MRIFVAGVTEAVGHEAGSGAGVRSDPGGYNVVDDPAPVGRA